MSIEIVLSTYNGSSYVVEQLESLLAQSCPADIVTIADDGSTDNCYELVASFISSNSLPWKLRSNSKNIGWKESFGRLIMSATGDYVFPCDQDDIWDRNKLKTMSAVMDDNPHIDVLASTVYPIYEDGSHKSYSDSTVGIANNQMSLFSDYSRILTVSRPGCSYCIRRSFVDEIREYWDYNRPHDLQLWTYAAVKGTLGLIDDPLVIFRRHANNASSRTSMNAAERAQMLQRQLKLLADLERFHSDLGLSDDGITKTLSAMSDWLNCRIAYLEGDKAKLPSILRSGRQFYPSKRSQLLDILQGVLPSISI